MIIEDNKLYQVGGVVRDEILGIESIDVDYCYEGNAIDFAQKSGLKIIKTNPDFGTVRVVFGNKEIDIASTRCEEYPRKGHLPVVKNIGCPIKEDLIRRDFTINAIAKRTTDGEIVDIFNGRKDIETKTLRILHKNSFIDDPTRIIRGLKFAARFGFKLDDTTRRLQEEYIENVNCDMSYHRLKNELKDAFSLNRHEVFDKFVQEKMYKLLGENNYDYRADSIKIEKLIKENPSENSWLIYLSFFNLSKLDLTKKEKKILEEAKKDAGKNTPLESILIKEIRKTYAEKII